MMRVSRTSTLRLQPAQLFTLTAIGIVAVCATILRSTLFIRNPEVAAWGVTFDLTLTIPFVYFLTVVRPGHARAITIAPVFVIGVAVAARLVPHRQQSFGQQLRFVAAPPGLGTRRPARRRVGGLVRAGRPAA